MENRLKEMMAELFNMDTEEITDSLIMKNTDVWNSLKHMELIVSIEELFGVELTFDEIVSMQTFKGIKLVLNEKGFLNRPEP